MTATKPASDPTSSFTDMQWFMYGQRNVAFFGAFTRRPLSDADLLVAARELLRLAPQLRIAGEGDALPDALLRRLVHVEAVESLADFPDAWFDSGRAMFDEPTLPLFRLRYARSRLPTQDGRFGFLLVQVAHALVEGADSALLSRSQSAAHPVSVSARRTAPGVKLAATAIGVLLASLHLIAGNLINVRPGPYRYVSRTFARKLISEVARSVGVRQRALFYALVLDTLFDMDGPRRKRTVSSTYSVIDEGGGADRDSFMRMRMLFAAFRPPGDGFTSLARAVDAELARSEAKESGFNAELNAAGIRVHRVLSRLIPFAYRPRLFQFMPYDVVLGLIPPHRLTGGLTRDLMEPVYAGAALEGSNACVIVPSRDLVTFNFYIQQKLLDRIPRLDARISALISGSSAKA